MVHVAFRVSFCTDDETCRKAVLDIPIHDFNIVVYVLNTQFVNETVSVTRVTETVSFTKI